MQVWLRSVWQPSLPKTENSDARIGSSSAIVFADPLALSGPGLGSNCLAAWSFVQPALFLPIWASSSPHGCPSSREESPGSWLQVLEASGGNRNYWYSHSHTYTGGEGGHAYRIRGGCVYTGSLSLMSPQVIY